MTSMATGLVVALLAHCTSSSGNTASPPPVRCLPNERCPDGSKCPESGACPAGTAVGLVFEEASEVLNNPGAPRTDPLSWSFPAQHANRSMVLAGSVGALFTSTDGGSRWRPAPHGFLVPEVLSAAADPGQQTRMALTGNGVPNDWTYKVSQGPFTTTSHLQVHANRTSSAFSSSVLAGPHQQVTWGRLPAPTVIFSPTSGGIARFPDGMLIARSCGSFRQSPRMVTKRKWVSRKVHTQSALLVSDGPPVTDCSELLAITGGFPTT